MVGRGYPGVLKGGKMANTNGSHVFTKSELARYKADNAKMTPAQKRSVSEALVKSNTKANNIPKKGKK